MGKKVINHAPNITTTRCTEHRPYTKHPEISLLEETLKLLRA